MRSGLRLGIGGLCLPLALNRGRGNGDWKLISVDVFGTLLARRGDDDAAWRESALHAAEVARRLGISTGTEAVSLRLKVECRLSRMRTSAGKDPEFCHQQVFEEMLRDWGAGQRAATEEAFALANWELEHEIAFTRPVETIKAQVQEWAAAGRRVVAVSDTRYTARELEVLLSSHGVTGLSAIYASADEGVSKFSGKLFDVVAKREHVEKQRMLHVGDDLYADVLSASQRGLAVRRVRRPPRPESLPQAPQRPADCADPAFAVGYQTFGPILVAFSRLLIDHARRDGMRRLFFVARDGDLLMRLTQTVLREQETIFPEGLPLAGEFSLHYLHLSRRSLACALPELQRLGIEADAAERVLTTLKGIRGVGSALESLQSYYNAPAELLMLHARRLHAERGTESDVRRLLCDKEAGADLAEAFRPMKERVRRYLVGEGVLCEHSALVDIGWRGSLQKILQLESRGWNLPAPQGYYLGIWNEDSQSFPEGATGLITDQRRGRGLLEGAAWHAAFLLEAVCRARHGIVSGFAESEGGRIEPVHVEGGGTREAEREAERTQIRVQNGVFAYAEWFARTHPLTVTDEVSLRQAAQRRLHRLAFFPTKDQRDLGRLLVHSEPTSDGSALYLIASPEAGLSGWIAGLRSPWKGGYLRANGGGIAAVIYCAIEGLVSYLPPGTKPAIRRLLLRR
jgi:FMN phosphatase YigB (HAD superfamily)